MLWLVKVWPTEKQKCWLVWISYNQPMRGLYCDSVTNEKQESLAPDDPEGDESETLETLSQWYQDPGPRGYRWPPRLINVASTATRALWRVPGEYGAKRNNHFHIINKWDPASLIDLLYRRQKMEMIILSGPEYFEWNISALMFVCCDWKHMMMYPSVGIT